MEKMLFQPERETTEPVVTTVALTPEAQSTADWRTGLPVLTGSTITLRELRASDAGPLFQSLTTAEVARFISPPPSTVEGFERFIAWTHRRREAGQYVCFAVVPRGSDTAVGLFQIRALDPSFLNAEWGFAIDSTYWGTGAFLEGADLVLAFAFDTLRAHRLEARASVRNGRGNAALRKLGAVQEALLRQSFLRDGEYHDQVLWTILRDDWTGPLPAEPTIVH